MLNLNLDDFILSYSGWRKIFAENKKENSLQKSIGIFNENLMIVAAFVIANFLIKKHPLLPKKKILLARDSRPTGKEILKIIHNVFSFHQIPIENIGITSIPQAMAYVKKERNFLKAIYLTASHNPPGYNGLKIGNEKGEVLHQKEMNQLITQFKETCSNQLKVNKYILLYQKINPSTITFSQKHFLASAKKYTELIDQVCFQYKNNDIKKNFQKKFLKNDYFLACDFNGSSRINSIDKHYLSSYHIHFKSINKTLGHFAHRIVPEGKSLNMLKAFMKKQKEAFLLGYCPDCDGDRGNLVVCYNKKPVILQAQVVFALCVISELSFITLFYPQKLKKLAIIANDATSLRIDQICSAFNVSFFQAEVGEANLLSLAKKKKQEGFYVHMLGEGSNGGNITQPSTIRDPLLTLMSLLKFIFLKEPKSQNSLLSIAIKKLNLNPNLLEKKKEDILYFFQKAINWYTTTSVFEKRALVYLKSNNPKALKKIYEQQFEQAFKINKKKWKKKYNFYDYQFLNYEADKVLIGPKKQIGKGEGGFKVLFFNQKNEKKGFLWMRGSKTEPVFRISCDLFGDQKNEKTLLNFHRKLIKQADKKLL